MSKYLPLILTAVASAAAVVFTPAFVAKHVDVFAALAVAAQVLHAVLPSVFGPAAGGK